jgi:predicted branched-subunit amino acid permease
VSRAALVQGAREAAGIPAAVLAAGYLGFGALAAGNGLPLAYSVAATLSIWALPGQLILVEAITLGGAPFIAVVLTVALSSARFLPMTLVLMPLMRDTRHRGWHYYLAAQLLAMTGWTAAMARMPDIPRGERLAWFYGFATVCIGASAIATAAGYGVVDLLTPLARAGLAFMAPMYYLLILLGSVRERRVAAALACGAVLGPLAHLVTPQWSVLAAGLLGGTLAWVILRGTRRRG